MCVFRCFSCALLSPDIDIDVLFLTLVFSVILFFLAVLMILAFLFVHLVGRLVVANPCEVPVVKACCSMLRSCCAWSGERYHQ